MPTGLADPERRLAVAYAAPAARARLAAVFALDERLAGIVAGTTEPTIGLMRLVWWRDALAALGAGPPPAEPLLVELGHLVAGGVPGAALAAMVAGWEALLDDPDCDAETIAEHARARGAGLFVLAGDILSAGPAEAERLATAGEGWARADLARRTADFAQAAVILASALPPLERAMAARWPRSRRPIAQLAMLALDDARRGVGRWRTPGAPARLLRVLRFHTIGR